MIACDEIEECVASGHSQRMVEGNQRSIINADS